MGELLAFPYDRIGPKQPVLFPEVVAFVPRPEVPITIHPFVLLPVKRDDFVGSGEMTTMHYLYIICSLKGGGPASPVTIGISHNPISRMSSLQTANPEHLILFACFAMPKDWAQNVETDIHEILRAEHVRGEWFSTDPIQACATVCAWLVEVAQELPDEQERTMVLNRTGVIQNLEKLVEYKKFLKERESNAPPH